jgi:regulatory protein
MNSPCKRRLKSKNTEQSSPKLARQYALRLLSGRDYSIAQLKQKLRARNFTEADLEEAVSGLEIENWISDRRFAERFAESALASGRFYGFRLRMEMLRRGISETVVSEVIDFMSEGRTEDDEAALALVRHFPDFSFTAASDKDKRRVLGFLQRRGFHTSAILRAMRAEVL